MALIQEQLEWFLFLAHIALVDHCFYSDFSCFEEFVVITFFFPMPLLFEISPHHHPLVHFVSLDREQLGFRGFRPFVKAPESAYS